MKADKKLEKHCMRCSYRDKRQNNVIYCWHTADCYHYKEFLLHRLIADDPLFLFVNQRIKERKFSGTINFYELMPFEDKARKSVRARLREALEIAVEQGKIISFDFFDNGVKFVIMKMKARSKE